MKAMLPSSNEHRVFYNILAVPIQAEPGDAIPVLEQDRQIGFFLLKTHLLWLDLTCSHAPQELTTGFEYTRRLLRPGGKLWFHVIIGSISWFPV